LSWINQLGELLLQLAKEHGFSTALLVGFLAYLLWLLERKDRQLIESKDREIERLVKYKKELQDLLLRHLNINVERLSSSKEEKND